MNENIIPPASIVFGLLVLLGKAGPDGVTIVIAFLLGAFAPKAVQKFAEAKGGDPPA